MMATHYFSTRTILLLFAVLLISTWAVNAQNTGSTDSADKPKPKTSDKAPPPVQTEESTAAPTPFPLSVKAVTVNGNSAGLNDTITITVENLKEELARQQG